MVEYSVNIACGAEIDNKIYMSSISLNGLFEYDLEEKQLRYLSPFLKESPCHAIHRGAVSCDDEVWFVPQHGKYIAVLNRKNGKIDYITPEYEKSFLSPLDKHPTISYCYGKFEESKLYMLPAAVDAVNIIDMKTKQVQAVRNVIAAGEYISAGIYHDGIIHAFTGDGKWRIEIDPVKLEAKRYSWCGYRIVDIKWVDNFGVYCIKILEKNIILTADENFDNIERFEYMQDENETHGTLYMKLSKGGFYLFPWKSTYIVKMSLPLMENRRFEISKKAGDVIFFKLIDSNKYTMGVTENASILIMLNEDKDEVETVSLKVGLEEIQNKAASCGMVLKELFRKDDFAVLPEEKMGLRGFLEYVKNL